MEQPKCGDCRFFTTPGAAGDNYGVCVRFPGPQNKHRGIDWCGEFQRVQVDVPLRELSSELRGAAHLGDTFTKSAAKPSKPKS